jgi:hypothetical protein
MTIQQSIDTMQAWTYALRIIMGYPAFAPVSHTITFASGGRRNPVEALQIAAIVEEIGCDIVHVSFDLQIADGPASVSLATRATCHVDWHPEVRLYAASDDAPVELLTDRHRWFVGPRAVLTAAPLPPRGKIRRGVERAMRRWREQTLRSHNLDLTGSVFVPQGASFAQAVPLEALKRAA